MLVNIHIETLNDITIEYLKDSLKSITLDYNRRKKGVLLSGIYNSDPKEDLKEIKKTINSLKRTIEFFGGDYKDVPKTL
jgi:hypothetical protein